jgi:phosphohistidine phosphatase SixA
MHPEHKTVTLIRHAKDEQAEKGMSDMDRPLKQKGEKQAAHLAKELKAFLQQPPAP